MKCAGLVKLVVNQAAIAKLISAGMQQALEIRNASGSTLRVTPGTKSNHGDLG